MPSHAEWLIFVGTAVVFAVTPGPAMLYVLARSLHGGRVEGARSALGNALGTVIHVLVAAAGLSALLAASPAALTGLKIAGATYLAFLGTRAIRNRRHHGLALEGGVAATGVTRSAFAQGVVVEVLNPKTALYFMALLPQFVDAQRTPPAVVFLVLGLVAALLALSADLVVALTAGHLRDRLAYSSRWQERQRAASGVLMIGLGAFVAIG